MCRVRRNLTSCVKCNDGFFIDCYIYSYLLLLFQCLVVQGSIYIHQQQEPIYHCLSICCQYRVSIHQFSEPWWFKPHSPSHRHPFSSFLFSVFSSVDERSSGTTPYPCWCSTDAVPCFDQCFKIRDIIIWTLANPSHFKKIQ
jgi:hypothetical protein